MEITDHIQAAVAGAELAGETVKLTLLVQADGGGVLATIVLPKDKARKFYVGREIKLVLRAG